MMATTASYQRSDSMNCAAEAAEELLKLRMNIGSLATTIDTTLHCLEQENKHDDTKRISIDNSYIVEDDNATTDTLSAELLSIMEHGHRPKRPLSAFNLFYRFKRTKILEATAKDGDSITTESLSSSSSDSGGTPSSSNDDANKPVKEMVHKLITATPGLEAYTTMALSALTPQRRVKLSRTEIRSVLKDNLSPNDTRDRLHRKNNSAAHGMSFVEMSRIMSSSWKAIDDVTKAVFEELAEEGRKVHQKKIEEYEKKNDDAATSCQYSQYQIIQKSHHASKDGLAIMQLKSTSKKARALEHGKARADGTPGKQLLSGAPRSATTATKKKRGASSSTSSSSKSSGKSSNKKKDAENDGITRPKRPLSAYNLFYRYKRIKILKSYASGKDSNDDITNLITSIPGLECYPSLATTPNADHVKDICRKEIRSLLEHNLAPNEERNRLHRKSHGYMSFAEMSKIMCSSWKAIDEYTKTIFEELAQEGRKVYQHKVSEYQKLVKANNAKKAKLSKQLAKQQAVDVNSGDSTIPPGKNKKVKTSHQYMTPPPLSASGQSQAPPRLPIIHAHQEQQHHHHYSHSSNSHSPDFDQICNPNLFTNLDGRYYSQQQPQQQQQLQQSNMGGGGGTTMRYHQYQLQQQQQQQQQQMMSGHLGGVPSHIQRPFENSMPQVSRNPHHHQMMSGHHGGIPSHIQRPHQPVPASPLENSTPQLSRNPSRDPSVMNLSRLEFDSLELEPLPMFPNIMDPNQGVLFGPNELDRSARISSGASPVLSTSSIGDSVGQLISSGSSPAQSTSSINDSGGQLSGNGNSSLDSLATRPGHLAIDVEEQLPAAVAVAQGLLPQAITTMNQHQSLVQQPPASVPYEKPIYSYPRPNGFPSMPPLPNLPLPSPPKKRLMATLQDGPGLVRRHSFDAGVLSCHSPPSSHRGSSTFDSSMPPGLTIDTFLENFLNSG